MNFKHFLVVNISVLFVLGCSNQSPQASTPESSTSSNSEPSTVEISSASPTPVSQGNETNTVSESSAKSSGIAASGTFASLDHPTAGEVNILTQGDREYLELSEDFQTDDGPELVVVLHRSGQIQNSALNEGDYFALAPLEDTRGSQRYEIPEGIDLADYGSVAIWCREFNVTFGYATLQSPS